LTLHSSSSASHPIGTTIRVQGFLERIPVRKQTAVKAASRSLLAIKKLLYAYAFARPTIRFSLKVLKGKNDKANWLYAASAGSVLLEAAAKIVGKDVAAHCEFKHFSGRYKVDGNEVDTAFSIDALVLRNVDSEFVRVRADQADFLQIYLGVTMLVLSSQLMADQSAASEAS
jgi:DNA mismatch repair ATPase MutL